MKKVTIKDFAGVFRIVDVNGDPARYPGKAKHLLDFGGFSTMEEAIKAIAKLNPVLFEIELPEGAVVEPEPEFPEPEEPDDDAKPTAPVDLSGLEGEPVDVIAEGTSVDAPVEGGKPSGVE